MQKIFGWTLGLFLATTGTLMGWEQLVDHKVIATIAPTQLPFPHPFWLGYFGFALITFLIGIVAIYDDHAKMQHWLKWKDSRWEEDEWMD